MHAAALIRELKLIEPETHFTGIGGSEMKKENARLLYDITEVNFIGFSSVLRNIVKIKKILNQCVGEVKRLQPDAVILVDFPGFNLKFISSIRKFYKGKIIYYISPQLWAWHKSRVKIIKKHVDLMIVVFPFEVDFYNKEDIQAEYVGHPLIKKIDNFLKTAQKQSSGKIQISFLPGSRKDEIERILPELISTAGQFKRNFDCEINIICSSNYPLSYYKKFAGKNDFSLIYDVTNSDLYYRTILNSDLVIAKSGTSTMECALIGTPFCVVYKTGKINYMIGKNLINVDHIAMVNIILGKEVVKEFIQDEMNTENLFNEGKKILTDKDYSEQMKRSFIELRKTLTDKDASKDAANVIMSTIN